MTASFIPSILDELDDVVIASPAAGQVQRFNGTNWVNAILAHADLSGIGVNAHSVIDTHLASTSNPHGTTLTQQNINLDGTLRLLENQWINTANLNIIRQTTFGGGFTGYKTIQIGTGHSIGFMVDPSTAGGNFTGTNEILFPNAVTFRHLNTAGTSWTTFASMTNGLLEIKGSGAQLHRAGDTSAGGTLSFSTPLDFQAAYWNGTASVNISIRTGAYAIDTAPTLRLTTVNPTNSAVLFNILTNGNIGVGTFTFGTSAAKVVGVTNGTAPSTSPADMFQLWSDDQAIGNACPFVRTENGAVIKLYRETGVADAAGGATIDAEARTAINAVITRLENIGLLAVV